ncbi:MAG: DUF4280 domain-containing protein [Solirubrobacteraceae bacterium]|jgi:hypothetical protein
MGSLVGTGAALQCSFGTTPATFTASSSDVSATQSAAGVVGDVGPANVAPFGMCTSLSNPQVAAASSGAGVLTPQPCQPVLSPWTPGSATVSVDGSPALDDVSTCSCAWGGSISVGSAGQQAVTLG